MMAFFRDFGASLLRRWQHLNFNETDFPNLASESLRERPPSVEMSYLDVIEWVQSTSDLPFQPNSSSPFGQPPLTVYWHPRFYIELLFWTTSTTSIHQHSACGAFGLLEGTSIQSCYDFDLRRRVSSAMMLGDLTLRNVRYLRPGDAEPIHPGSRFIHSVFHLEYPSVSIVVRTPAYREAGPTYEYHPPHLCLDAFHADDTLKRRLQTLKLLRTVESANYQRLAGAAIEQNDLLTGYRILEQEWFFGDSAQFNRLLSHLEGKHGVDIELLSPVFEERARLLAISKQRRIAKLRDHRFFLALLMTLPDRRSILGMIEEHFPGCDAKAKIQHWCAELSGIHNIGIDFDELNTILLDQLLDGRSFSDIESTLIHLYGLSAVRDMRQEIAEHCHRLQTQTILRPLLHPTSQSMAVAESYQVQNL